MSKKYPNDMDFRASMPCPHCQNTVEEFNTQTGYMGCPNCERAREKSLAIMRINNIRMCGPVVCGELCAGPQVMATGDLKTILEKIDENGWTVDGVNYDSYEVARQKRLSED